MQRDVDPFGVGIDRISDQIHDGEIGLGVAQCAADGRPRLKSRMSRRS